MSQPPYTPVTGKIKDYFAKIQTTGVPDKVNRDWLKQIGFKSSNDQYVINIWKYIGFIDDSNIPSEYWKQYRVPTKAKSILAEAIRKGYRDLFQIYKDAYRKDREAIYAYFSATTGKAEKTINMMVTTFTNLCELADFEAILTEPIITEPVIIEPSPVQEEPIIIKKKGLKGVPEIHINIQLMLPETTDISVYDRLFESLKRHLLTDEE